MHQPEYNEYIEANPEMEKAFSERFDQQEKKLKHLVEEYGQEHVMRIFRPKKKDYLKPPKK
jgi:hypothetical protein